MNQFSRLELLLGKSSINLLKNKVVAIFGLGGVGGNVVDALARSGVSNFVLIDNDEICLTNINRQLIATLDTVGLSKVDVMESHILSINKQAKITKYKLFYLPENSSFIDFSKFDYVVDAIDTVAAKLDIIEKCHNLNIPLISALGCGNKLNPSLLEITDISKTHTDPLAKVLRKKLRERNIDHLKVIYSTETPIKIEQSLMEEVIKEEGSTKKSIPGSSAFVPPVAGIMIAAEVVKDLLNN